MLTPEEKAFCRALEALSRKDFDSAVAEFDKCGERIEGNSRLQIMAQTARILCAIRKVKNEREIKERQIKEAILDG